MKRMTVIDKILCVFKPKKISHDILTEAENIINQYISHDDKCDFTGRRSTADKLGIALNIAIILSAGVLGYLLFRILR